MSDKDVDERFVYEMISDYWSLLGNSITPTSFTASQHVSYAECLRIEDELCGLVTFKGLDRTEVNEEGRVIYWQA